VGGEAARLAQTGLRGFRSSLTAVVAANLDRSRCAIFRSRFAARGDRPRRQGAEPLALTGGHRRATWPDSLPPMSKPGLPEDEDLGELLERS
jgi:hypothetical protein